MAPLLEIEDLRTQIKLKQGTVRAVNGVSLHVDPGETLGVVGESGCGKTMTALSIMNLLPVGGHIVGGSIRLNGREISNLSDDDMRDIRGNEIGMIFQDPLTSLNPTMTVGGRSPRRSSCTARSARSRRTTGRWRCWTWSGCRRPRNGSASTRTSSPAGCGSG